MLLLKPLQAHITYIKCWCILPGRTYILSHILTLLRSLIINNVTQIYINNWLTQLSKEWWWRRVCTCIVHYTLLNLIFLFSVGWIHKCGEKQTPAFIIGIERFVHMHVNKHETIHLLSQLFNMTHACTNFLFPFRRNGVNTVLQVLS